MKRPALAIQTDRCRSCDVAMSQAHTAALRKRFIVWLNTMLDPSVHVPESDGILYDRNLFHILTDTILTHIMPEFCRTHSVHRVRRWYPYDSPLINQFLKQSRHPRAQYLSRTWRFDPDFSMRIGYQNAAARFISMIFNGKEIAFSNNLDTLFNHHDNCCQWLSESHGLLQRKKTLFKTNHKETPCLK